MTYLICEKCGGYYELQEGEKAEDFSDECECGGKLVYTESLSGSHTETENHDDDNDDSSPDEPSTNKEKGIADDILKLNHDSKREEVKHATELQEILDVKGYYIIKGMGPGHSIKVLTEGIETGNGQFIGFENIISIEDTSIISPKTQKKSGIGGLISSGQALLASKRRTLKIVFNEGEIEFKDIKKSDAKKLVSFVNRMLNKD
ncbi:MAG: hypothetical protein HY802_09875 [Methanobacterium sp.]|nr:hypothetical protein [Methanobacterium sp.]